MKTTNTLRSATLRTALVVTQIVALGLTTPALGISDYESAVQGQHWYGADPAAQNCSAASSSTAAGDKTVVLNGKDPETQIWNYLIGKGLKPFQAAGLMGNLDAESSFRANADQLKGVATTPTDKDGFGIVQWTYASRQNQLSDYAATMVPPQAVDSLEAQLAFMWYELTSTDTFKQDYAVFQSSTDVASATSAIMNGTLTPMGAGSVPGFAVYEAPASIGDPATTAARTARSQKVLTDMGASSTTSAGTDPAIAAACSTTVGAGNGSIVKTAMSEMTWPKPECTQTVGTEVRNSCPGDARAAYVKNIVNPGGDAAITDCGTFVSTVMHVSGVDSNYPVVSTTTQIAYLRAHPEKYQITEQPKSTSQLLPGDILIYDNGGGAQGHTMIYLGAEGGQYPRADASWHGHTPQMNDAGGVVWIMQQSNMLAARVIK